MKPDRRIGGWQALLTTGATAHRHGRLDEAEQLYRRVLAAAPGQADALYLLGMLATETQRFDEALALLGAAVTADPARAAARSGLGSVLLRLDRADEAVSQYRAAVELSRGDAGALYNLARALQLGGHLTESVRCYARVLEKQPRYAEAFANMGVALRDLGLVGDAIGCFVQALALRPDSPHTHMNLGNALKDAGHFDDAATHYRRALALDSRLAEAHSNLLFCSHYAGTASPLAIADAHRAWDGQHGGPPALLPPLPVATARARKLRIGYVSPDLQEHSVACFAEPVLAAHDRDAFDVYLYSDAVRPDAVTARFRAMAGDLWRDVRGLTHERLAHLVRSDGIDILVDLAGHTAKNRLPTFACRAAPVQLTWIGYPDTTGLSAMDYRFTDAEADPPGTTDALHTEQLVRLPSGFLCYQPPDGAPEVAEAPALAAGHVTFGCFGYLPKISDATLAAWGAILRRVPSSRLLLKARALAGTATRERLLQRFAGQDIPADRITLHGHTPSRREHLGAYAGIDVALDTFPYNGTTTTCEALWMGVPVVALTGATHVARVGTSLLTRVGLTELLADSTDDYIGRAVALAGDEPRRLHYRESLRARMQGSPLMDAPAFTRAVEDAYRSLWRAAAGT